MEQDRIAEILRPFLAAKSLPAQTALSVEQFRSISIYIELLLRWNARINLTAVRAPEAIVSRHFGESLFLAAHLFGPDAEAHRQHALDLGSGAGFPGLPLKIYAPQLRLTLVESNRKKASFLGEVIRALQLRDVRVFSGRVEASLNESASGSEMPVGVDPVDIVTMRAVERFESALATAAVLVRHSAASLGAGKLALLVGLSQAQRAPVLLPDFSWQSPIPVPESRERVVLVGRYQSAQVSKE